ncbi:hypothetical protein IFM89_013157 [Coptis chinensis]|uniref:Replication protein A 70 kDa DNA-binding subunit B/D first OB fold domain-containing protein n=1 Tax=Coptis chinensis TaxID=261450 RepID=A0A835IM72_9MAGN|nr:hypothetical protein IFM89_013157 [Coptis chinensis]
MHREETVNRQRSITNDVDFQNINNNSTNFDLSDFDFIDSIPRRKSTRDIDGEDGYTFDILYRGEEEISENHRHTHLDMTTHYNLIKQATKSVRNLKLKVRIDRSWDQYLVGNETLLSKDMILIDEKGDQINASILMEIYPQFKEKVQDGSVVHLKKFTVKNVRSYCLVNNKNKITFEKYTTMRNISDETSIPRQLFSFVDFKKLSPRDKQDEFLTPTSVNCKKNVHTRMGQSDKKSIYIDNERYKVQFEIEDSTCKKLITSFDDEAEYLLQRPLDELLKIEKQGIKIKQEDEEPNAKKQYVEIQYGLVVEGGGEMNGIEGIVVGRVGSEGMVAGMVGSEMDDMGVESGG